MWRLILNLLLVKIGGVSPKKHRIIGGTPAQLGEFPYLAALFRNHIFFCAGSLYQAKLVLTAAHCVHGINPRELVVMVGDIYIRNHGTPSRLNLLVSNIIVHPNYNLKIVSNDIAILVLWRGIIEDSNVGVIPINTDPIAGDTSCDTAGWGAYQMFDNSVSPHLLKARFTVAADDECNRAYRIYDTSTMMCAGVKGEEVEACPGDSGGPLICNGKLTGIVSYGAGCEGKKLPTIYTSVAALHEWIASNSLNLKSSVKQRKVQRSALNKSNYRSNVLINTIWITISAVSNFCDH